MSAPPHVPLAYRVVRGLLRLLCVVFFRRVEVVGQEHVPATGGAIFVTWHPNGLVDPGLLISRSPRQVVFGARHGLFKWPLLGFLLRRVGTVPIYRAVDVAADDAARREGNQKSLDALASRVAAGSVSSLFPEGVSHDEPRMVELKTGAARLFLRACALTPEGAPRPIIIPVGLHYDEKDAFRSNALVAFNAPLELAPELLAAPGGEDELRERARAITAEIERVLHDVVLATEDWPIHRLMHRARKLMRAERAGRAGRAPGPAGIVEKTVGFARVRQGYLERRRSDPAQVEVLRRRVEAYDEALHALGLEDHELDQDPRLGSWWLPLLMILQAVGVFLLLPPLLILGTLVNGPAAVVLSLISRFAATLRKDVATIKIFVGALLFPATWLAVGLLAAWGHRTLHAAYSSVPDQPVLAGVLFALLGATGGAAAVRYGRVAKETARSVGVRITRRRRREAIERLLGERAVLHDAIDALAAGLPLPGAIASDGSIRP